MDRSVLFGRRSQSGRMPNRPLMSCESTRCTSLRTINEQTLPAPSGQTTRTLQKARQIHSLNFTVVGSGGLEPSSGYERVSGAFPVGRGSSLIATPDIETCRVSSV